jgi:hypothetical protein
MEPFLVFRRTGRTIAAVVALGFGGGTLLLGLGTTLASAPHVQAALAAARGYFLAALPFFVGGAVLAVCKRELWFVPEARAFRMLTYRPWRFRGPRVEQASIDDYRALCTERPRGEQPSTLVSLVTESGETVPIREFEESSEASAFAKRFAEVTGLPLRTATEVRAPE